MSLFLFTYGQLARITSCFVRRDRVQTRDARGGVGAGGGYACAVEARRRGVAMDRSDASYAPFGFVGGADVVCTVC